MAYMGAVVGWGGMKGFGFINCDGLEGDVFFGRAVLPPELKDVAGNPFQLKGRNVVFDLNDVESAKGKLVAATVRLAVSEGETCTGMIRSFDNMSGKGWIDCASIDCGLAYNISDLPPHFQQRELPRDTVIQFMVGYASDGTFEAKQIQIIGGPGVGGQQFAGKGGGAPKGGAGLAFMPNAPPQPQMKGACMAVACMGGKGGMATGTNGVVGGPLQDGMRLQGSVVSYNQDKGFGFLQSPSAPGHDMYFKGQGLEIAQGTTLCFSLKVMPDGKMQARDIAHGLTQGGSYLASVTSYSQKNGWGFFTVPSVNQDVYFQRKVMPPHMHDFDVKGATATIMVHITGDGKPQCASAEFLDEAPPGYVAPLAPAKAGGGGGMGGCMGGGMMSAPIASAGMVGVPMMANNFGGFAGGCQPQGAFGGAGCYGNGKGAPGQIHVAAVAGQPAPPPGSPPAKRMRGPEPTPDASGETVMGNILSYNPMKGWGFIKSDMVAAGDV